jgi:hypothetical protein
MPDRSISGTLPPSKQVAILDFRPLRSGPLIGFVDVVFPWGLILLDLVFGGTYGRYVQLPSRVQIDGGQLRRGPNGKIVYAAAARWTSKELATRFSKFVVSLLERDYTSALTDRAA